MKSNKIYRLLCVVLTIVMLLTALTSCGKRLTIKGGKLTDRKLGITYTIVPNCEPKSISNEVYATHKLNGVTTDYYTIEGFDPAEWICDEYGQVYYSGEWTCTDLRDFAPTSVLLCTNSDVSMSFAEITEAASVETIVKLVTEGKMEQYPNVPTKFYVLRFTSEKYPALYFCMKLICTEDTVYINYRDEMNGINVCVDAGNMFDQYISENYHSAYDEN
ncbi:MAG: hypothetical protein MJ102_01380 [Clostridia bacterium]|nr:hypothetical protein [Clostridia bacterium]